ncbi:MAG TPA: sulfite exporter TauE/SafE family protein [Victivallales bacterium]|nr:sulfite exporter TauE/SafE family protein [Victivallales bacterium]
MPDFSALDDPYLFWFLSGICAFAIGFSKNGVVGAGILAVPLMAYIFPAKASTGILLPMLVGGDIIAVWTFRKHGEWKYIMRALPWALIGIVVGWKVMQIPSLSADFFKYFIAVTVMAVIVLGEWLAIQRKDEKSLNIPHSIFFAAFFGVLGGFTTMTANVAGPVFAIYLLSINLPKENFIGSMARIFLILNVIKIPFSAQLGLINYDTLIFNITMLPITMLGAYFGFKTAKIIPQKMFNFAVKILALLAAIKLLF